MDDAAAEKSSPFSSGSKPGASTRIISGFSIECILAKPERLPQKHRQSEPIFDRSNDDSDVMYANHVRSSVCSNPMACDTDLVENVNCGGEPSAPNITFNSHSLLCDDAMNCDRMDKPTDIVFSDEGDGDASETSGSQCDDRKKRPRTAFSASQIKTLETEFERGKYLSVAKRTALAKQLHLSETQIKIWFQNRRTKWKRKYTSDVETLASQYYAQIGIGAMARPMVVGDRLWLFSQTPGGHPVQSMLLNNNGPPPVSIPPLQPNNNVGPPKTNPSPVLESARNSLLARGQPLNYGLPKTILHPFHSSAGSLLNSIPFAQHNQMPPRFNPYDCAPYLGHTFNPNPTNSAHNMTTYGSSLHKALHHTFAGKCTAPHHSHAFLPVKYQSHHHSSSPNTSNESAECFAALDYPVVATDESCSGSSGIAELEKAFGDRHAALLANSTFTTRSDLIREAGSSASYNNNNSNSVMNNAMMVYNDQSSSSDVDCEEMDGVLDV